MIRVYDDTATVACQVHEAVQAASLSFMNDSKIQTLEHLEQVKC